MNATFCAIAAAPTSRCAGWLTSYSVVLDWRFLPKWDAYIGTMYSAEFGGIANGDIARNNVAPQPRRPLPVLKVRKLELCEAPPAKPGGAFVYAGRACLEFELLESGDYPEPYLQHPP